MYSYNLLNKGSESMVVLKLSTEYQQVYNAMTIKPSHQDAINQDNLMKALVSSGLYAKAEFIDIFATHFGGSNINWVNPGTHNPIPATGIFFNAYEGYRGNKIGDKTVNLNFIPSTDSTKTSQDNVCMIIGVGEDGVDPYDDFGTYSGASIGRTNVRALHDGTNAYFRCNSSAANAIANVSGVKHYAVNRHLAASFDAHLNKTKTTITATSNGVSTVSIHACGGNEAGTIRTSGRIVRYVARFQSLSDSEIYNFMDIVDAYLLNYKTDLLTSYNTYISKAYPATKINMTLTTYDGGGETAHPSVVDTGVSGWNGYRYWMANTPYPASNNAYENPSIWASSDGVTWVVPAGVTNPVIAKPSNGYNADTELYFEDNTMYLYWKQIEGTPQVRTIEVVSSTDGFATISTQTSVLYCDTDEYENVSPSVIKDGDIYKMYYYTFSDGIQTTNPRLRVAESTSPNGSFSNKKTCVLNNEIGFVTWHLDVIKINNYYYLAASSFPSGGLTKRVYIYKSNNGLKFKRCPYPVLNYSTQTFDSTYYYRPTLCEVGGQMRLYYSAYSAASKWTFNRIDIDLL